MTREQEKTAMFAALMEITNVVNKVKKLSPVEQEFMQKELLKWLMGIKVDGKGSKQ